MAAAAIAFIRTWLSGIPIETLQLDNVVELPCLSAIHPSRLHLIDDAEFIVSSNLVLRGTQAT